MKTQPVPCNGFTLTEFLIATVIMSILIATSIPQLNRMFDNNRMQADVAFLRAGFQLARSEAVARNAIVAICGSVDLAGCGGTFSDGWVVFEDMNGDGVLDTGAGDEIIRVGDRTMDPADVVLTVSDGRNNIIFNGQGRSDRAVDFSLCDPDDIADNRAIRVMATGQINGSMGNVPVC